jgi:uncharacterized protein YqeY
MQLEQQIMAEMKEAMKAKDEATLRGLRAIKAEIIKAKTEPGAGGEIDEATEQKFLQKMMKQRRDSLETGPGRFSSKRKRRDGHNRKVFTQTVKRSRNKNGC